MSSIQTFLETLRLVRADLDWRCDYECKRKTAASRLKLLFHPGIATLVLFRWQRFFDTSGLGFFGAICRFLNIVLFTSTYSSSAQLAGGTLVVHAVAIHIGDGVVLGKHCVLYSQNSVSASPFANGADQPEGAPFIEEGVIFGIGAAVEGPTRIGRGCKIGMNTLVETDAPPGVSLLGVPARIVHTKVQREQ